MKKRISKKENGKNWYGNMSEDDKQKLQEHQKTIAAQKYYF